MIEVDTNVTVISTIAIICFTVIAAVYMSMKSTLLKWLDDSKEKYWMGRCFDSEKDKSKLSSEVWNLDRELRACKSSIKNLKDDRVKYVEAGLRLQELAHIHGKDRIPRFDILKVFSDLGIEFVEPMDKG
jgi:hypothetical protein